MIGRLKLEWAIDQFDRDAVTGWVWASMMPALRLILDLEIDGKSEGLFSANDRRSDLLAVGKGDGRYGFHIPLGNRFADGAGAEIKITPRGFATPISTSGYLSIAKGSATIAGGIVA